MTTFSQFPARLNRLVGRGILLAGTGILAFAVGCSPKPAEKQTKPSAAAAPAKQGASRASAPVSHVTEDEHGRKYFDGIPYDVWFDDPLSLVDNPANVATRVPLGGSANPTEEPEVPVVSPSGGSAETTPDVTSDWETFIDVDHLQEETKKIRNRLKSLLQTPGAYSSEFEEVKLEGALLAALAVIASEQPEPLPWKQHAGYLRDYSRELFESAKGPGRANYDQTRGAFENLESVWNGSLPVGAPEPVPDRPLHETADRFYLMRRMKLAFDALKSNINTEAKIKSEQELAVHESMILSALAKVVAREGYTSADEPEYQQQIQQMIQSSGQATRSAKGGDFSGFQEAVNHIEKSCNECHVQYRNG